MTVRCNCLCACDATAARLLFLGLRHKRHFTGLVYVTLIRCTEKGGAREVRSVEHGSVNCRFFEGRALEVCVRKITGLDVGSPEDGALQVRASKVCTDETAAEIRPDEGCLGKVVRLVVQIEINKGTIAGCVTLKDPRGAWLVGHDVRLTPQFSGSALTLAARRDRIVK